jgi:penicillin-binding protein 1C
MKRRHGMRRRFMMGLGLVVAIGLGSAAVLFSLPLPRERLARYPAAIELVDREGTPLRVMLGRDDYQLHPVPLARTGAWAGLALVAAEDKRFYRHGGIDLRAIARAAGLNVWRRRVVSGASTLTTQVVKMVAPRRRSPVTKLIEATQAVRLEREQTKAAILEQYLNRAPMGGNLYGVQAAARRYFGRDAAALTLGEASLLMGLPQSPSRYRPDRHLERALARREYVLGRMAKLGYITNTQRRAAESQPLRIAAQPNPFLAPHFCDFVLQRHGARLGDGVGELGDGPLRTTLDPRLQRLAEDAARALTARLNRIDTAEIAVAVVILDVADGAVRALVGSADYDHPLFGQVNCAALPRSPGSALKPFAYAMAIDQGYCTPDSMVDDRPRRFRGYVPENFQRTFRGRVSVRAALVESLNIPALTLVQHVGLDAFAVLLRRAGLNTIDRTAAHYGLSLVLGTGEVTLLDLVNAYACLARGGQYRPYRLLDQLATGVGAAPPLVSAEAAYLVADMLSGPERSLAGAGHMGDTVDARVAWKTGTSNGHRDAWTIAYNPAYVVGVWVGNPTGGGGARLVGIEHAAPTALRIFRRIYPSGVGPWFARPADLETRRVCPVSGCVAGPLCPVAVTGDAIRGVSDPTPCRLPHAPSVAPFATAARQPLMTIATPPDGARYELVDELPRERQQLPLKASGGTGTVWWFVDRRLVGQGAADQTLLWPLERGVHTLACADAAGRSAQVSITVR